MNEALLNKTQDMIIDMANQKGRSLEADFGTEAEFRKFVIGFTIQSLQDTCGMEIREAYDTVFGQGEFHKLADKTFTDLQLKNAIKETLNA